MGTNINKQLKEPKGVIDENYKEENISNSIHKIIRKFEETTKSHDDLWNLTINYIKYLRLINAELQKENKSLKTSLENEENKIKNAYDDGYKEAIGKINDFVLRLKENSANIPQTNILKYEFLKNADDGGCYQFSLYNVDNYTKHTIIKSLIDVFKASTEEAENYVNSLSIIGRTTVLFHNISYTACKKLARYLDTHTTQLKYEWVVAK